MAQGGIHDQLGGGFHRYSTDAEWKLPHFGKMLYDNALLGESYSRAFQVTGQERYRAVAEDIYSWVAREMTDSKGGFYSAAPTPGADRVEGAYYTWTLAEFNQVLGDQDGQRLAAYYHVQSEGNFQEQASHRNTGANVLYRSQPSSAPASGKRNKGHAQLNTSSENWLRARSADLDRLPVSSGSLSVADLSYRRLLFSRAEASTADGVLRPPDASIPL